MIMGSNNCNAIDLEKLAEINAKLEEACNIKDDDGKADNHHEKSGRELFDIAAFLDEHGVEYKESDKDGKRVFNLKKCPFNEAHKGSAFVQYEDTGITTFKCFHSSCSEHKLIDALRKFSGDDSFEYEEPDPIEMALEGLNEKHAVANINGKYAILNEAEDPLTKLPDVTFSKKEDFINFYSNVFVTLHNKKGTPQLVPITKLWLSWVKRRHYKGLVFSPNQECDGYYNFYKGFAVSSRKGDWSLFRAHIFDIIADGDPVIGLYVLCWLADAVQNVGGERPGTAIVLLGKQGCGKGTFVTIFGAIFGSHFLHLYDSRQLTGQFNDHLKSALLVFGDEAVWGGDKTAEGKIKAMITEERLFIEPKGVNGFQIQNNIRMILASNNDWCVPAGMQERRFLVLEVSDKRINDFEYFKAIRDQMENGGLEAMLYDLLNVDLSQVNLRKIPRTKALFHQQFNSMPPIDKFWYERLNQGAIADEETLLELDRHSYNSNFSTNTWPKTVAVSDLYTFFKAFCHRINARHAATITQMGLRLKKLCPEITKGRGTGGDRKTEYRLPSLERCRALFEEIVGMELEWDSVKDGGDSVAPVTFEQLGVNPEVASLDFILNDA